MRVNSAALVALFTATSALAVTPTNFIVRSLAVLSVARIDPIASKGEVAPHVHSLFGASNIRDVLNSPEEQQNAQCTSAITDKDKSNYWAPTLYFIKADGSYEGMPHHARVYYFVTPGAQPWPKGMRIVTGTPMKRDWNDIRARGLRFHSDDDVLLGYLPTGNKYPTTPGTVKTGIHFPSCGWANQSLDSDDHWSHLTWPIMTGGGEVWHHLTAEQCPETHPIKYPTMFFEVSYYPTASQRAEYGSSRDNFILSNGDTVGLSYHADFVAGWDEDVLRSAMKCDVKDAIDTCPALANGLSSTTANNCRLQGMVPDEEVGLVKPLKTLPGCNPKWTASMGDSKPMDCPDRKPDPGWTPPNALWYEYLREATLPLAVDVGAYGVSDVANITPTAGREGHLGPWGQDQWTRYAKFPAPDAILRGTAQDIADNLDMSTARNKRDVVPGLNLDGWNGMQPPSILPESAWSFLHAPNVSYTYLPLQTVGRSIPSNVLAVPPPTTPTSSTKATTSSSPAQSPSKDTSAPTKSQSSQSSSRSTSIKLPPTSVPVPTPETSKDAKTTSTSKPTTSTKSPSAPHPSVPDVNVVPTAPEAPEAPAAPPAPPAPPAPEAPPAPQAPAAPPAPPAPPAGNVYVATPPGNKCKRRRHRRRRHY